MSKNAGRRTFLKKIGISSITAGVLPAAVLAPETANAGDVASPDLKRQKAGRQYNDSYSGENLTMVSEILCILHNMSLCNP